MEESLHQDSKSIEKSQFIRRMKNVERAQFPRRKRVLLHERSTRFTDDVSQDEGRKIPRRLGSLVGASLVVDQADSALRA